MALEFSVGRLGRLKSCLVLRDEKDTVVSAHSYWRPDKISDALVRSDIFA